MSVFNEEHYVLAALESILSQSLKEIEVIVVDDGSTDGTRRVLEEVTDPRVDFVFQENVGLESSLNRALQMTHAPLIARMDADDVAYPDRLERQADEFAKWTDLVLLGTWCLLEDEARGRRRVVRPPTRNEEIRSALYWRNPFIHSSTMFRRSAVIRAGGYRPELKWGDWELWWRLSRQGTVANLPEVLMTRRRRAASTYRFGVATSYREALKVQAAVWNIADQKALLCAAMARSAVGVLAGLLVDSLRSTRTRT